MSGTVTFNVYNNANRVPGVYFEVNATQANTGTLDQRTLLIGQMLSTGTATANLPILCTGQGDTNTECGIGSMLSNMLMQYRLADPYGEVWLLPLVDQSGSTAGTQTITFTGPATSSGTLDIYVCGIDLGVGVTSGDTATVMATNVAAAITAQPTLPITAVSAAGVVTVTCKNKGLAAGDVDIRMNYNGKVAGEVTPPGVTVVIAAGTAAATDPTGTAITTALTNLGDTTYDFIVTPYTGSTEMTAVETFLSDVSGRWSYVSELFGGAFSAYRGTAGALTSFGATNNNQHISVLGFFDSPTPAYQVACDYAGTCAQSLRADPALPLQNIFMNFLAPPIASRFTYTTRETLLYNGIATFKTNDFGQTILERAVTTYQQNAAGAPDNSYLDVETLYTLMFLIRDLRSDLQTKYSRVKLVSDNTRIPFGVNFVTSQTVKNEVIANYRKNSLRGLCQDPDTFAQNIVAQNAGNGQVSIMWPGNLANQLRVIAVLAEFIKT